MGRGSGVLAGLPDRPNTTATAAEQRTEPPGQFVGPWESVEELNAKLKQKAGFQLLGARLELAGNVVRLRGMLENAEEIKASEKIFKLPAGLRPAATAVVNAGVPTSSSVRQLEILATGEVKNGTLIGPGATLNLDGITFNLT